MARARLRKRALLFLGRLPLVALLPLRKRHAVNTKAGIVLRHLNALRLRRFPIPIRETIAAKTRQYHQINVLNIRAILQMPEQPPKGGGFQFFPCGLVQRLHVILSTN